MSVRVRIGALYSRGTHYPRLLRFLREEYPGCEITAIVPPSYPERHLEGQCDSVIRTECEQYGFRELPAARRLLERLRVERFDALVVMFPSVKLRCLARAAGAGEAYCYTADRRFFPVELQPARELLAFLARRIRGRIMYAYIRWVIRTQPVERESPHENGSP